MYREVDELFLAGGTVYKNSIAIISSNKKLF
jgi:hypothetical protein